MQLLGPLVCTAALSFVDGILAPGAEVDRVEPTDFERRGSSHAGGLDEDVRRDVDKREPREWVVVVWQEKRRRVPLRAFRRPN